MSEQTHQSPVNQENEARSRFAYIYAWIILVLGIVFSGLLFFLSDGAWQYTAYAAVVAGVPVFAIPYLLLRRHDPPEWSFTLLAYPVVVLFVGGFLVNGIGYTLLAVGITLALISTKIFTGRRGVVIAVLSVLAGATATALDFFTLASSLPAPETFSAVAPYAAGLLGVFVLVMIVQDYSSYTLRTKLIGTMVIVVLIGLAVLAIVNVSSTTQRLETDAQASLEKEANSIGELVGAHFDSQLEKLTTLALSGDIRKSVTEQNDGYTGSQSEILASMESLDSRWVSAGDNSALISKYLQNDLSDELREMQKLHPEFVELFVTDIYGGLVATSNRTSDYYQADEDWWQVAYNNGSGAIYIGQPEVDESTQVISTNIAVPIYKLNSTEILGILRATYSMNDLLAFVQESTTYGYKLELIFPAVGTHSHESGVEELTAEQLSVVQTITGSAFASVEWEGEQTVASDNIVHSEQYDEVNALGWLVLAFQNQEQLYAPVQTATRSSIMIAVTVALISSILAAFLAQQIANPVLSLTEVAQEFASGNYNVRSNITSGDEIGDLSKAFNQMAQEVGDQTIALAERAREMEASQRVTFAASERTTPDDFLDLLVNLIVDQFDIYHAQVYLLDADRKTAVLSQSTGYAGRQLLQRGHSIPLERTSLVTQCINTGEPVLVGNTTETEGWLANPLLPFTQSELVVPLKIDDVVIGALDIQAREADRFTKETVPVFESMTEQVAFLYQNNELLIEIEQRTAAQERIAAQLQAGTEVANQISTILDPDQLLDQAVVLLQGRFNLYHAHVYLFDEARENLVVEAGSGQVGIVLKRRKHSIAVNAEKSIVARAARSKEAVLVADTTKIEDWLPNPLLPDTKSELALPLIARGEVLGVLDLQDENSGRFTSVDASALGTLAGQIATAIENAQLFVRQRQQEQRFMTVADYTYDWETWQSAEGPYNYVSPACERITGYKREEFLENPKLFKEIIHPEDKALYEEHEAMHFHTDDIEGVEFRIVRKDGGIAWIGHACNPVFDADDKFAGRRGSNRDITEEHAARVATAARLNVTQDLAGDLNEDAVLDVLVKKTEIYPNARVTLYYEDFDSAVRTLVIQRDEAHESGLNPLGEGYRLDDTILPFADILPVGESFVSGDVQNDPRIAAATREVMLGVGYKSIAIFPMKMRDNWVAYLFVTSQKEDFFNDENLMLFNILAEEGTDALLEARLRQEREEERQRFEALVTYAPDAILMLNYETFMWEDANKNAEAMFGLSREELLKTGPGPLSPEFQPDGRESGPAAVEIIQNAVAGGEAQFEWVHQNAQGKEFDAEVRIALLPGEDKLLLVNITDITDRKQAQAEIAAREQQFRQLVDNAPDGIFLMDPDTGKIEDPNGRVAEIVGTTVDWLVGKSPADFSPELDPLGSGKPSAEVIAGQIERVMAGENLAFEWEIIRQDSGWKIQVEVSLVQMQIGNRDMVRVNIADITDRKQAQQAIVQGDRLKSEFLANMSHELRTPLNSILGYTDVLLMGLDGDLEDDVRVDLEAIHENSQHLLRLINDILDLAKIEAGRMTFSLGDVNVPSVLEELRRNNAGLLVGKDVELIVDAPEDLPHIVADERRVYQVINNLVSNAVKFTEEGSITMRAFEDGDDMVLQVEDTGMGIDKENLDAIFEEFTQVDNSSTRQHEGTGLGLTITRRLVHMHGGTIGVDSEVGKGSVFTVRLPKEAQVDPELLAMIVSSLSSSNGHDGDKTEPKEEEAK